MKQQPLMTAIIRFPWGQYHGHAVPVPYLNFSFVLRRRVYLCPLPRLKLQNGLEILLEIWILLIQLHRNILTHSSLRSEVSMIFKKSQFASVALWCPVSAKSCLTSFTFLLLFTHLIFCSVLYSINYLSFIFSYTIIAIFFFTRIV